MRLPFHLFNLVSGFLPARCHKLRSYLLRRCGGTVGCNVRLNANVTVYGARFVTIGQDTWISSDTIISGTSSGPVTIGSRCDIGPGVMLVSGSHVLGGHQRRAGPGLSQPIVIGDGCWVGARSLILGGAGIGAGCVVAAGAVVLAGTYPPNVLLAGVPAVLKRELPGPEAVP
jgi:maltose O-acetyltransferase